MTYPLVTPPLIETPFASGAGGGYINTIPIPSQIGITPGAASYVDGFPPVTMQNPLTTGVPPFGQDFNGILNAITAHLQNQNAGQRYKFNATLAAAIGGYPAGTVLQSNDGKREYISIVGSNTTDFNSTPSSIGPSWRLYSRGSDQYLHLTGTPGATVTLDPLTQAGYGVIDLAYTLTGDVAIIVPTIAGASWKFNNNSSGGFNITIRTAAGSGFILRPGQALECYCDGVNIIPVGVGFTGGLTANNYMILPNRLILNWGSVSATTASDTTWNYPITFPNAAFIVTAIGANSAGGQDAAWITATPGLGSVPVRCQVPGNVYLFALGY